MDAYKCDRCLQFFDVTEEDVDKDGDRKTHVFDISNDQWAIMVGMVKILPPPSDEAPDEAKQDTHHIDGVQVFGIEGLPTGLQGIMGALRGHTHKHDEPQRRKADLCLPCKKAVLKELVDEYLKETPA